MAGDAAVAAAPPLARPEVALLDVELPELARPEWARPDGVPPEVALLVAAAWPGADDGELAGAVVAVVASVLARAATGDGSGLSASVFPRLE